MSKANETQIGGRHYQTQTPDQPQHWDIVAMHNLDYFQGQITKYVMRWKNKNGLQDLQKAQHFLQKYIELNTARETKPTGPKPLPLPQFIIDKMSDEEKQKRYDYARSIEP